MEGAWKNAGSWDPLISAVNSKRICIVDEICCEGRPLVHSLLATCAKMADGPTIALLSFDRPSSEYIRVGRRLGHDLDLTAIKNRFSVLDGFTFALRPQYRGIDLDKDVVKVQEEVLDFLNSTRKAGGERPVFIFLEGLSTICSLGWPLGTTIKLIESIEKCSDQLCIRINREVSNGKELSRWLIPRSDIVLFTRSLASSNSTTRLVHGEIFTINFELSSIDKPPEINASLFKTSDATLMIQPKSIDNPQSICYSIL